MLKFDNKYNIHKSTTTIVQATVTTLLTELKIATTKNS